MRYNERQLRALRAAYDGVRDIPDGSSAMARLKRLVSAMPAEAREQVEREGVRWLAPVARAHREGVLDGPLRHSGGHPRDNGRGFL